MRDFRDIGVRKESGIFRCGEFIGEFIVEKLIFSLKVLFIVDFEVFLDFVLLLLLINLYFFRYFFVAKVMLLGEMFIVVIFGVVFLFLFRI